MIRLQQPAISSSSTRLQTRSCVHCTTQKLVIASPDPIATRLHIVAYHYAPPALTAYAAARAAASRPQQRCLVAAAAAKKQAARSPAGKGFGNPNKLASKVNSNASRKCPCGSGQLYPACCGRYHAGAAAPTPEALLRARFSAYSMQLVDYLVATTHPQNAEHTGDPVTYARSVQGTARRTEFVGLTVLGQPGTAEEAAAAAAGAGASQQDEAAAATSKQEAAANNASGSNPSSSKSSDDDAFLKFTVKWRQRGVGGPEEATTEVSHFKRVNGTWLYYAAVQ